MKTIQRIIKYVIKNDAYENEFVDADGDSFTLYRESEGLYLDSLDDELCCFDTKEEAEEVVHKLIGTGLYEYNLSIKKLVDTVVLYDTSDKECGLDGQKEKYIDDYIKEGDDLLKASEEYIDLLEAELEEVVSIASNHGWKSKRYEKGKILRENLHNAKNFCVGVIKG